MSAASFQRCPSCKMTGKVYRSKIRTTTEKLTLYIKPFYRLYRCHHCNWRGTLPRRHIKPWMVVLGKIFFYTLLLSIIVGFVLLFIKYKPTANFRY